MAIPWISLDPLKSDSYIINEEATKFLASLPDDRHLAVIAVVGRARTGKSFLLNRGILKLPRTQDDGFKVSPTVNSCTKGLWIYPEIVQYVQPDGTTIDAIVVDSEGLSACDSSANHDTRVFALTLLLSSFFLYNSRGNIDESAISDLGMIVDVVESIQRAQTTGRSDNTDVQQLNMPFFLWVMRDFSLVLKNRTTLEKFTAAEYLEQELSVHGTSGGGCRKLITKYFKHRNCLTLVRPCTSETDLCKLSTLPDSKIRKKFLKGLNTLDEMVAENIRPKKVQGVYVTGTMLKQLASTYVAIINSGKFPVLQDTITLVAESRNRNLIASFKGRVHNELSNMVLPVSDENFRKQTNDLLTWCTNEWNTLKMTGGACDTVVNTVWIECRAELQVALISARENNARLGRARLQSIVQKTREKLDQEDTNQNFGCALNIVRTMCDQAVEHTVLGEHETRSSFFELLYTVSHKFASFMGDRMIIASDALEELRTCCQQQRDDLEEANSLRKQSVANKRNLHAQLEALKLTLDKRVRDAETYRLNVEDEKQEAHAIQGNLASAEAKHAELDSKFQRLMQRSYELHQESTERQKNLDTQEEAYKQMETQYTDVLARVETLVRTAKTLKTKLIHAQQISEQLETRARKSESKEKQLLTELKKLRGDRDTLQNSLNSKKISFLMGTEYTPKLMPTKRPRLSPTSSSRRIHAHAQLMREADELLSDI